MPRALEWVTRGVSGRVGLKTSGLKMNFWTSLWMEFKCYMPVLNKFSPHACCCIWFLYSALLLQVTHSHWVKMAQSFNRAVLYAVLKEGEWERKGSKEVLMGRPGHRAKRPLFPPASAISSSHLCFPFTCGYRKSRLCMEDVCCRSTAGAKVCVLMHVMQNGTWQILFFFLNPPHHIIRDLPFQNTG